MESNFPRVINLYTMIVFSSRRSFAMPPVNESWFAQFEHINSPDGEIRPVVFYPAKRRWDKEPPIGHIDPKTFYHKQQQGRIIGGRYADLGEAPYQVAIINRRTGQLTCGGTIYNRQTILTAAHCMVSGRTPVETGRYVYIVGALNLKNRRGTEMQRLADSFIVHPKYNPPNGIYDVAVIKLKQKLRYTYYIQPLQLGNPVEEGTGIISGWGYTRVRQYSGTFSPGGYTDDLKVTTIKIFKRSKCAEVYDSNPGLQLLVQHPNYMCAGELAGGKDACAGDSGGPLACSENGVKYLCGIVSSGIGCGLPQTPGFFMNMTELKDWVEDQAGKPDKPKRT